MQLHMHLGPYGTTFNTFLVCVRVWSGASPMYLSTKIPQITFCLSGWLPVKSSIVCCFIHLQQFASLRRFFPQYLRKLFFSPYFTVYLLLQQPVNVLSSSATLPAPSPGTPGYRIQKCFRALESDEQLVRFPDLSRARPDQTRSGSICLCTCLHSSFTGKRTCIACAGPLPSPGELRAGAWGSLGFAPP